MTSEMAKRLQLPQRQSNPMKHCRQKLVKTLGNWFHIYATISRCIVKAGFEFLRSVTDGVSLIFEPKNCRWTTELKTFLLTPKSYFYN